MRRRCALVWKRLSEANGRNLVIARSRKILCIAALALGVTAGTVGAAGVSTVAAGSLRANLLWAGLSQAGRSLTVTVVTAKAEPLARLHRFPNLASPHSSYLCVAFRPAGKAARRELCLGGSNARRWVGLSIVGAAGRTFRRVTLAAKVKQPNGHRLVVTLLPPKAGLRPGRYRWQVHAGESCEPAGCVVDSIPPAGYRTFRLRPVREVGCTGGTAGLETNGPRGRKVVALTFDDGPSTYTPGFLRVLRDKHVHGTFFEIGQEMAGRGATMRRILADGNEIGNHTMHHGFYPGYGDLAATSARIKAITHFRPCLFRPPGGGYNSSVIAAAGRAGMRTITWDVDPTDWSTPGTGAIYSRVVGAARPGSIVIMHDGGGNRSETLAALPSIIHTLRARGYGFETVTELLGYRTIYRPYG